MLVAGFGAVGVADHLLDALHEQGARELTIVANNSGNGDHGLARLINSGRVRKVICSFPRSGDYSAFLKAYRARSLELELLPQGTISERMRCHAAGLGGFFSPVSAGTKLGEGKETREIDGRLHVFEKPLKGDVALIKANKADRWGNLTYMKSARNFNPVMAMAADLTVVEVDQMVELGELDPEAVVTPEHLRRSRGRRGSKRMSEALSAADARTDGLARRAGFAGRRLRQSRHRHSDPGREFRARRARGDLSQRERHSRPGPEARARQGRPLHGRRRQEQDDAGHRAAASSITPIRS